MPQESVIHSDIAPRNVGPLRNFDANYYGELPQIGVNISPDMVAKMMEHIGMDALTPGLTTPSVVTPVQFLQNWLPGFVAIVTAARKIDELVGITTAGSWEDEEIVQGVMEQTGFATPYGDLTNVPFASWNTNFAERTVIRFEEGMQVAILEEKRAARIRINSAEEKRKAATLALEIQRNAVGFFGYNGGANLTYGFLNDPGLPNFVLLPATGAGGLTTWASKTFQNIQADLRLGFSTLRTQSNEIVDPENTDITIACATVVKDYFNVSTDYGESVMDWLKKNYPRVRIVSAPELNAAHASDNVIYIYAEKLNDGISTDDGRVFMQMVPTKFMTLGVEQRAKSYVEDYSNATAGVWCKRPIACVRYYGA